MEKPTPGQTVRDPATNLNSASPGPMKLQWLKNLRTAKVKEFNFKYIILGWAFYCSFYNSVYNLYDTIKWKTQKTAANSDFNGGFQGEAVRKGCKYDFFSI